MGRSSTDEDPWSLSRSVTLDVDAGTLWPWLTEGDRLDQWWCPPPTVSISLEPRVGGQYEEHYQDGSHAYDIDGTVEVYDPPMTLAIRRHVDGDFGDTDIITFSLISRREDTLLTLEHSFPEIDPSLHERARAYYLPGWADSLARLHRLVTA